MIKGIMLAKYIVTRCMNDRRPINNLKLNKIIFIIQREYAKRYDKKLIDDDFTAKPFGSVVPDVYEYFFMNGSMDIIDIFKEECGEITNILNASQMIFIDAIIDKYRDYEPWDLISECMKENGAWSNIYNNGKGKDETIPFQIIKERG